MPLSQISKELLLEEIPESPQGMIDFRRYAIQQVALYKKQIERLEFLIYEINKICPADE